MHRRLAASVVAALALTLTGCVLQPPPVAQSAEEAWRVEQRLVTYPQVVGDLAIAYTSAADDDLALTAWRADGSEAWTVPTAPLTDGVLADVVPVASGTRIPVVVPVDGGVAWGAVDVSSGDVQQWTTRIDGSSAVWPRIHQVWRCAPGDDQTALCFSVDDGSGESAEFLRLRPDAGIDETPYPSTASFIYATDLGVYTDDGQQTVELLVDGTRRWSRPWTDLFEAPFVDGGLEVVQHGDTMLVTTFAGWSTGSNDATGYETAAIDVASGSLLWTSPGSFPCATSDEVVLCAATGDGSYDAPSFASIAVRGVEPRTGAERWSIALDAAGLAIENDREGWTWFGDPLILAGAGGRPTIVDLATGEGSDVPAGAALPCSVDEQETFAHGDVRVTLSGAVAWCDASTAIVADPLLHADVVGVVGLPLGDVLLVPERGALVAYRV